MKKIVVAILLLSVCSLFAKNNRYDMKSGIVEYDIIGISQDKNHTINGTSVLYFKDFGNIELIDERVTQQRSGFDIEEERVVHKISKNKLYTVDFNDEMIYSQVLSVDDENPISNIKNRETFNQMGAKFLGNENILGYKCDIWELGEYKIWVYNSVPLKQITNYFGIQQMQIAKNADFNINIKDDKFKLPNFPTRTIDIIINQGEGED